MYLNLLTIEGVKIATIYFFEFLILIAFIKLVLFSKQGYTKEIQKIIGGLTVFIVAILSDQLLIYFLSLFIGGLIIASEEFLKFIFAIWKSDSRILDKTIQSFTKATAQEIEKKKNEELQDVFTGENMSTNNFITMKDKYIEVEKLVHNYFKEKYGGKYLEEVKIQNNNGSIVFDGVIVNSTKSSDIFAKEELKNRNDLDIRYAIEIKYFKNENSILPTIQKLIEKISYFDFIVLYKIVIVVDNLNFVKARSIYSELTKKYSTKSQFEFDIFSFKNERLEVFKI